MGSQWSSWWRETRKQYFLYMLTGAAAIPIMGLYVLVSGHVQLIRSIDLFELIISGVILVLALIGTHFVRLYVAKTVELAQLETVIIVQRLTENLRVAEEVWKELELDPGRPKEFLLRVEAGDTELQFDIEPGKTRNSYSGAKVAVAVKPPYAIP